MLSFYSKQKISSLDNSFTDYCKKTTQESIKRLTAPVNLDNNINLTIKKYLNDNDIDESKNIKNNSDNSDTSDSIDISDNSDTSDNSDNIDNGNSYVNFYGFLAFLSISSIIIYVYKRKY